MWIFLKDILLESKSPNAFSVQVYVINFEQLSTQLSTQLYHIKQYSKQTRLEITYNQVSQIQKAA